MLTTMTLSYEELAKLSTFTERFNYLKLDSAVGDRTFGGHRWLNQRLYQSNRWLKVRDQVICRDNGCDLGVEGYELFDRVLVHHINPITLEDLLQENPIVYDPNNLITVGFDTHNAIHFGNEQMLQKELVVRKPNDTCPWKE